jgi:hypothetical protein
MLAEGKHEQAQAKAVRVVRLATQALQSADETGCVLLALQSKAKGSFLDGKVVRGTEISKSAAYRYMDLAKGWHHLETFEGMPSQSAALRHIESEQGLKSLGTLEEPADLEAAETGEDDDGNPVFVMGNSGKTGRPKSRFPEKLQRRVVTLIADTRLRYHDDPQEVLSALGRAIDDLEKLAAEVQEYIEEGITNDETN